MEVYAEQNCKEVENILSRGVALSEQGRRILNHSQQLAHVGRIIFLDRYSVKDKRNSISTGDMVIATTLEDQKYSKRELAVIKNMDDPNHVTLHMITGPHACEEENFEFVTSLDRCDKPLEAIDDSLARVAKAAASVEAPEKQDHYYQLFYDCLKKKYIQPAGRIMTGATADKSTYTKNLTLYNCYVLPSPKDSRDSIINDAFLNMVETMSRGGGVGLNLSTLRPRYAYVRGVHGKSSGAVSWGGLFSFGTGLIEQGGSRRGALMLMLEDWHPDIEEFITAKTQMGRLENANISVLISDRFMEAVKHDLPWTFEFPDYEGVEKPVYDNEWDGDIAKWKKQGHPTKKFKTIRARDLWGTLIKCAWGSGEPGIVFLDRYNKMSNSWYFNRIISTNPCGEQGLPGWGVCNLSHLYLASFAKQTGEDSMGPTYEIDWENLKYATRTLARFLDNVIDLNPYHNKHNEENQTSERRVGGGTLGLGELLIKLRVKYGSAESIPLIEQIYKTICIEMYKESSRIAQEKGSFSKFDAEKFLQSGFMQNMPEEVRELIRTNGIRNVTLTTQAPTGTVGSMLGTSTGIEPYYSFKFYQQSRLGFHEVNIPLATEYQDASGNLPSFFASAMDLAPMDHVRVQAAVQKWTDSSISKTANAPNEYTVEETMELYEKAFEMGCKGVTIYRDGSRNEQTLSLDKDQEKKNLASSRGELSNDLMDTGNLATDAVEAPTPSGETMSASSPELAGATLAAAAGFEIPSAPPVRTNAMSQAQPSAEPQEQPQFSTESASTNAPSSPPPAPTSQAFTPTAGDRAVIYGAEQGNSCPVCKKGIMVKIGGCTECSKQCGFKGGCDIK
jgi:ribonucleoside-diphosphate reductase alpha chain